MAFVARNGDAYVLMEKVKTASGWRNRRIASLFQYPAPEFAIEAIPADIQKLNDRIDQLEDQLTKPQNDRWSIRVEINKTIRQIDRLATAYDKIESYLNDTSPHIFHGMGAGI
ncbi:MAG: hypothetical protein IH899_01635 [Planctomycetes bacterium]|nr:hypothetical protein [Planctomycetota bacterium]